MPKLSKPRVCGIDKCEEKHYAKGLCRNHYRRALGENVGGVRGRPAFAVVVNPGDTTSPPQVQWWSESAGKQAGDVYKLGVEQLHALLSMPSSSYDISLRSRFINSALGLENAGSEDMREEFRKMQQEMKGA